MWITENRILVARYDERGGRIALPSELRRCAHVRALLSLRMWSMISNRARLCRDVRNCVALEILRLFYDEERRDWTLGRPALNDEDYDIDSEEEGNDEEENFELTL